MKSNPFAMRIMNPSVLGPMMIALAVATVSSEARPWTAKSGKVVEAEYVAVSPDGEELALKLPDGRIVKTPVANLCEEDQVLVGKIKEEGPGAIPMEVDYGDINPDYLPPSPWPVVSFKDPGGWNTIDVTKHGLQPDSDVDAAVAISRIIADTEGRRRLFFPEGTYTLKSELTIEQGDIWLDGAGKETKFVVDGPEDTHVNGISFNGSGDEPLALAELPKRGDQTVELETQADLEVGDLVRVYHDVKDNRNIGFPRGQLCWITGIKGTTVTLDLKIGADFSDKALLRRMRPLHNVRLTNFSVTRLRRGKMGDHNLAIHTCANAEVRNVDSGKPTTHCISVRSCRDAIVSECTVHEYQGGKGWNGYGVTVEHSTAVNVVNNHGFHLRHHFELAWGTSYSVMAYNTAEGPYDYCDVGSHHGDLGYCNLFEGNKGQDVSMDYGESSWNAYTFFYRNQASRRIGSYRSKRSVRWYPVILGNETPAIVTDRVKESLVGANIVNGELQWGSVPEGTRLPASLFLGAKPDYLGDKPWPLFGPPVETGETE